MGLAGSAAMAVKSWWLLALLAIGTDASALGENSVPPPPTPSRPAA